MTNKTCGTCGHGYPAVMCSAKYPSGEVMCSCESCGKWTECTDSVEQIALDMLALIKAARMRPIVLDPNKMPGGQIFVPLPETEFADRMRAFGIEVPE